MKVGCGGFVEGEIIMQTERTGRRSWGRCMVLLGMMVVVAAADGLELLPSQCKKERDVVINSCQGFVFGQAASPVCCEQVKVFHFECLCPAFTPKLVALFDVNKAIKLLQDCGRRVPRHFKCGSKLSLSLSFFTRQACILPP